MILIYPDKLPDTSKVKMILDYLKYPYTYDIYDDFDIVFNSNLKPRHDFDFHTDKFVINGYCTNVLKDNVDFYWGLVYGSSLSIDPTTHRGWCIEKPLIQGTNSGNIVKCPYNPKDGMIYLRWVDTRDDNQLLSDYRVVVCDEQIVLVLIKQKPTDSIFKFDNRKYDNVPWNSLFTKNEHDYILKFAESIGLDFGEIDILRSNFDGNIYAVDVNNISGYGYFRQPYYVDYLSNIFRKAYLK